MYETPETGYAWRWEKVYTMDEAGYKTGLAKQKLYFVAHNKGVYGRVVMDVYPFRYMSEWHLNNPKLFIMALFFDSLTPFSYPYLCNEQEQSSGILLTEEAREHFTRWKSSACHKDDRASMNSNANGWRIEGTDNPIHQL